MPRVKKRDFVQQASIEFLPHCHWNVDKSIQYAEKLWLRLTEKGLGDIKTTGPREPAKAYDRLNPLQKTAFDLFWLVYDYKAGRDKAAASWLALGELDKHEYDAIISAAKIEAEQRKSLPEGRVPKMAQGWLSERRWLDRKRSETEKKVEKKEILRQQIAKLQGELAHAENMLQLSQSNRSYPTGQCDYWAGVRDRLKTEMEKILVQMSE